MTEPRRRRVVIVGGGTAGWMAAAALSKVLGSRAAAITLIESEEIGTVGVGEATIPPIVLFNRLLGIDEDVFLRETQATFKLGIEFVDWLRPGHRYLHSFGLFGVDMNGIPFPHYWLRAGANAGERDLYNAEAQAVRAGRFARTPANAPSTMPRINYAFQFDAGLYAGFLRRYSEARGVARVEGRVAHVAQDAESGHLTTLTLDNGRTVSGDFFIDCSGFRGLLIEQTLHAGYDDWSRWLPANRAVAVPCASNGPITPYTRATAREAGWQWRIPLQHRTGNGYVFCDAFLGEDEAASALLQRLDGEAQAEPRVLRFVTGRRRKAWIGNCVAMGLASGFLEPLESTSIHLVQAAIAKLLTMFPQGTPDPALAERYNREMDALYDGIRDFILAHYLVTERDDTPFWRHVRAIEAPESLRAKLDLFRARGEVLPANHELFREVNWFAVLNGQGMTPEGWHPVADALSDAELADRLSQIRAGVAQRVSTMPPHEALIAQCRARAR